MNHYRATSESDVSQVSPKLVGSNAVRHQSDESLINHVTMSFVVKKESGTMKRYFIYRHEYMAEDTYIGNISLSLSLNIVCTAVGTPPFRVWTFP